jgi:hypothetical protein
MPHFQLSKEPKNIAKTNTPAYFAQALVTESHFVRLTPTQIQHPKTD